MNNCPDLSGPLCEHAAALDAAAMLKRRPEWVAGCVSALDQPLLMGLTKLARPKKVLEIGVASGWSGCLFVQALEGTGQPARYIGVDYSADYYLDKTRPTGAALKQVHPDTHVDISLLLGRCSTDVVKDVGPGVDLAFIDGDHHHPWAVLDLLSLMPILEPSAHVLLHDLSLCLVPRHQHANRGPKHLYEAWPLHKMHSSQNPPMIGAIRLPESLDPSNPVFRLVLDILVDTLHTPWEVRVDGAMLERLADSLATPFGAERAEVFRTAFRTMNERAGAPPVKVSA